MFRSIPNRLAAALLAAGLSVGAQAAVTDLGPITQGATPFDGFVLGPAGSVIFDVFLLELPANGGSSYGIKSLPLDLGAAGTFGSLFESMSLNAFGLDDTPFTADDIELAISAPVGGATDLSLDLFSNPGGKGYIKVVGISTGSAGGIYSGAIAVTPVPEAETWAMWAAGLGLVGLQLRRRARASGQLS